MEGQQPSKANSIPSQVTILIDFSTTVLSVLGNWAMTKPELQISRTLSNGTPLAGRCSMCEQDIQVHQGMDFAPPDLQAAFEAHVKFRHGPDDED
jgi:hypothetical protein